MNGKKISRPTVREQMVAASKTNNTGEKAENVDPMVSKLLNKNNENDEINKLKQQLADAQKEKDNLEKLINTANQSHMIIAPSRLQDRTVAIDYPLKVFPEAMDYIDRNSRGSKNIVFNYLIAEGIKAVQQTLINNEINLDSEAKPK